VVLRKAVTRKAGAWTQSVSGPIFLPMSEIDFHPTSTFAVWADAFSPDELDQIQAVGDRLSTDEATLVSDADSGEVKEKIRITRTAWLAPTPETRWIYERMQRV